MLIALSDIPKLPLGVFLLITGVALTVLAIAGVLPLGNGQAFPFAVWQRVLLAFFGLAALTLGAFVSVQDRRGRKETRAIVLRPGTDLEPDTKHEGIPSDDASERLPLVDTSHAKEIVMYWGFRPVAQDDLTMSIADSPASVFISGMGLNTVADILVNPEVQHSVQRHIRENSDYRLTVMYLHDPDRILAEERGRSNLRKKLEAGRSALIAFRNDLYANLPHESVDRAFTTLTYGASIYPRHFFLRAIPQVGDATIYAGSYLSHKRGKYSYLLKLRDYKDGLFDLFDSEIDFLIENGTPVDLEKP